MVDVSINKSIALHYLYSRGFILILFALTFLFRKARKWIVLMRKVNAAADQALYYIAL